MPTVTLHYGQTLAMRLADILPLRPLTVPAQRLAETSLKTVRRCPGCQRKAITTSAQGWACRSCHSFYQSS